jgi:hypothetical protein
MVMQCEKCHSPRTIRFLDGFGNKRIFCRSCHETILIEAVVLSQKKLNEFAEYYRGRGWYNERISSTPDQFVGG